MALFGVISMLPVMTTENYHDTLPKKHMAAGALFFNEDGDLLLIKPSYKNHWSIPGGVVDAGESPHAACRREIQEEIGLDIPHLPFLCVDYMTARETIRDNLQFIFYGGTLDAAQVDKIRPDGKEITDFKFLPVEEAISLLGINLQPRIAESIMALRTGKTAYLESGRPVA